jgi:putative endonuclease
LDYQQSCHPDRSEVEGPAVFPHGRNVIDDRPEHTYYVYLAASRSHVLYCGVTNNLRRRLEQHREGCINGFTADYKCTRLVWFERFKDVNNAIAREKQIKRWRREKKIALIQQANPTWADLYESWTNSAERRQHIT